MKLAGSNDLFLILIGFVLFCLKTPHHNKEILNIHGLSEQEKTGQHSPP